MKCAVQCVVTSLVVLCGVVTTVPALGQQAYSYPDLIHRLIDLEHLSVLPADGETGKQWSSYDRKSTFDEKTGKYVKWESNGDASGFIRQEADGAKVVAEMEGPGCLWRIWSAMAETGHVKIYLDGSETPVVDLPFINYFDGKTAPFNYPMLSYDLNKLGCAGYDLYFPIPYQKSCKIVAEKGFGSYYHFNYVTFPAGTKVPTFSTQLAASHAGDLSKLNSFLQDQQGTDPAGERKGQKVVQQAVQLEPGKSQTIDITGPQAITGIRVRFKNLTDREDQMHAMRELVLKITFDGGKSQVWCPLGDFFGTAPGINLYKTLVTGMTEGGAYAYWYMPFGKDARVELINEGTTARQFDLELVHAPLSQPFEKLGYFHCKWHRDTFPRTADRPLDWSLLRTSGRGRFCGVMLHVWNPIPGWWGEGDEKFFVDGEKLPSTFGTGTEDYFGYAWCHPGLFQRPFHAQTMTQNNSGHQSLLRWQVADNVPFHTGFDGYIEHYQGEPTRYAVTVCWYLDPKGVDDYTLPPLAQRDNYYKKVDLKYGGYRITGHPNGDFYTQDMKRFTNAENKWHNDDQLQWHAERAGTQMELILPVEKDGKYQLTGTFTTASDYGIVQFSLDGKKVGEPLDCYARGVNVTKPIPLGVHELKAGDHIFKVEMIGLNPKAYKLYMFGLDELRLEPVK